MFVTTVGRSCLADDDYC